MFFYKLMGLRHNSAMKDEKNTDSPQLKLLKRALIPMSLFKHEAAGGVVLIVAAVLAIAIANSPAGPTYDALLHAKLTVGIAPLSLEKSTIHWVNDGLMAIFFFLVGLEIKRELLDGALSNLRTATLPLIGAIGGMIVPALIYVAINFSDPSSLRGWAIPAATDIAFAVGVIALLGSRVPSSLKIFILALAIIDDLGAIIIIAVFYTEHLSISALGFAMAGSTVLIAMNRAGVRRVTPYLIVGFVVWLCVLKSGVHATLAGVITAFAVPLESGKAGRTGPLERLEHALSPWVGFGVLPIFAFANAGVSLAGVGLAQLGQPIPLGIALGLLVGKAFGIFISSWMAIRTGLGTMPDGATTGQLFGVGVLGGIGFTMSLFIGTLAFPDPSFAAPIRIGVLAGSISSAILGFAILRALGRKDEQQV